jgi:hypothetical protein
MQCIVTFATGMYSYLAKLSTKIIFKFRTPVISMLYVYLCEHGREGPWLYFQTKTGPRAKKTGKHWFRLKPVLKVIFIGIWLWEFEPACSNTFSCWPSGKWIPPRTLSSEIAGHWSECEDVKCTFTSPHFESSYARECISIKHKVLLAFESKLLQSIVCLLEGF